MKSLTGSLNEFYSSDENICSSAYAPSPTLRAKSVDESPPLPFEVKKVQLDQTLAQKSSRLRGSSVVVVIDRQCQASPGALSERVLTNLPALASTDRSAFEYQIQEDLDVSQLEALAESDECVIGVSRPGTLTTAALALPAVNDTHLNQQSHLAFTNFKHAYDHLISAATSTRVQVALIDSGVDCDHTDLLSHLPPQCGDNMVNPLFPPEDEATGHGTHVAGLLGAVSNNSTGTAGVAGSVLLRPIKVIGSEGGSVQDAYDGIRRAISLNVDVINLSVQSNVQLVIIEQAVAEAVRAGIVVVMAAGNFGKELGKDSLTSPGMIGHTLAGAITVGSVDVSYGGLSQFSNFGNQVEIATAGAVDSFRGPTGGLFSLAPGNSYQRMMGTSQATPIVAGAAALVIQFLKQRNIAYTPADIERILLNSSDQIPQLSVQNGRSLNFSKLVRNTYAFAGVRLCN